MWDYFRRSMMLKAAGGILVGGGVLYWHFQEDTVKKMVRQFERTDINYTNPPAVKVDRPAVIKELQDIFLLPTSRNYYIIVGETGTGKSTAVQEAVSTLEKKPRGVIYLMSPERPALFPAGLAAAVAYNPNVLDPLGGFIRWVLGRSGSDSEIKWDALRQALTETARHFKEKHGRQPVLVIDAADFIAKRDPTFMKELQDFAKTNADQGNLRTVFVTSEGTTLPLMMGSSSIERGKVIEISDLPDQEALGYLLNRKVPEDRAKDAVANIIGGRLIRLSNYAESYTSFPTNAEYRKVFDSRTGGSLIDLKIKKDHDLFKKLLKDRAVDEEAAKNLVDAKMIKDLLEANILAQHPNGTYTFHSRVVETYFRSQINK